MKYRYIRRFLIYIVFIGVVAGLNTMTLQAQSSDDFVLDDRYLQEVDELVQKEIVQRAFQWITEYDDQTVQNQVQITEIPAPPFKEGERAEKFAQMMKQFGLSRVEIDDEGNVIGKRPGTEGNRTIVFSAHLDTVFPEETDVTVKVRNDTLYAPGISDDGRGLTVVLTALKTFEELNIDTKADIWFVGTVGEEGLGDLRGVKHLFRSDGPQIDAFISIDGSNDRRIVNRALGSNRYRITFEGPGGHSWGAFGTANPAHALGRAITYFEDAASKFIKDVPRTSYNIGRIGGGTSVNSVPFSNWMEVDMRSIDNESLNQIDQILKESVQKALREANRIKSRGEDLTVDIEMIGNRPSGGIDPQKPFIQRAIASSVQLGYDPYLTRSSTDSNVPISLGIPAITLGGGGSSAGAHSLDERWYNDNGYMGIQRAFLILLAEAGLAD